MFIGDSLLGYRGGHLRYKAGEDVGLSHDDGQRGHGERGEGRRVTLLLTLVQLQHANLVTTTLLIPEVILRTKKIKIGL